MQADQELSLHTYCPEENFDEMESDTAKISFEFTEKLKIDESQPEREFQGDEEEEMEDDSDDDEEEDGDDFSFASVTEELISPVAADKVFQDGQIRPTFPLFNRNLLLDDVSPDRLPTRPPVDKVFIESPRRPSNASENDEIEGIAAGPYCTWTKPAASEFGGKKSNSTGFSKLWRFKERINRSHSDGRDAFVFLNNPSTSSSSSSSSSLIKREEKLEKKLSSSDKKANGDVKVNGNGNGGKAKSSKKGGKKKPTSLTPHEAYLRSKLTEEDRRRSYLPYRPELMGFFTNVHGGGLTKNVHPF